MSSLPVRAPRRTSETAPFWDGCAAGRLVLPRCNDCGAFVWYPRSLCPACGGRALTWTELSGRATVHACTVMRRGLGAYRDAAPYSVAYVELDEGPRILTNIVGIEPDEVHIGMAVSVVFDAASNGDALYRFAPVPSPA